MPRWVKVSLVIVAVLAVLVVVMLLSGHGPSRHLSSTASPVLLANPLAVDRVTVWVDAW